ncbi:MAG: hypothetical protein WC321_05360 [Candidatus Omnitrophota bacterium]
MKKFLIAIIVVIVIILGGLVIARNIIARTVIVRGIKAVTGMAVDIRSISIGLARSGISVSGLKIYNPEGFKDRLLADIPELYVDFDLLGFFRNQAHLRRLKIYIDEFNVVLNESGKLNVNSLALFLPKPGGGKPPEVKIDELRLKIAKVVYKGYLPALGVKSGEFNIDIDETFHDVTNPSKVAGDILKRILNRIGIGGLENFKIKDLSTQIKEEAQRAVGGIIEGTKEDLKGIFLKE